MTTQLLPLVYTILITIVLNIPFGYWREGVKKFSLLWLVFIHAPVPAVIFVRSYFNVELSWSIAPFLFGSYFLGQYFGKILKRKVRANPD